MEATGSHFVCISVSRGRMSKRHVVLDQKNRTKSAKTFCFCIGYLTCQSNLSRSILPSLFFLQAYCIPYYFLSGNISVKWLDAFHPVIIPQSLRLQCSLSLSCHSVSLYVSPSLLSLSHAIYLSPPLSLLIHTPRHKHTHTYMHAESDTLFPPYLWKYRSSFSHWFTTLNGI